MKTNLTVTGCLMAAFLVAVVGSAQAASTILDFTSTGGTILDTDGQGTGFTTRLSGTGGVLPANDTNLDIDTTAGTLAITSTQGDINGQVNLSTLEFVGLNLSSLGFTGTENFRVHAEFINVPFETMNSFDQFGLYVGEDSLYLTRGMVVNYSVFGGGNEGVADNINNGVSANGNFFGVNPGATVAMDIVYIGGVWQTIVGGIDKTPTVQPTFLDATDFNVGVFSYSTDESQFVVELDNFTAVVGFVLGDADGDLDVDYDDFLAISNNLFDAVPQGTMGDANWDGLVDYADFRLWKNNYVPPAGAGGVSGAVPEPSGLLLALLSVLGLAWGRRFAK